MLREIIDIALKVVVTAVINVPITAVTCFFMTRKKRREKSAAEDELIKNGVQSLLRQDIIRTNDKYTEKGYAPVYAKESLERAYKAYHDLGGNDVATRLYHEVMALPESAK